MPVAQGGRPPARQAALIGLGALCGLLAVVFLVTRLDRLNSGQAAEIELGNPVFSIGQAAEIAPVIAEQGPLLLPDAARGDRDVWLNHLGSDPTRDWVAFAVRPPDAPRDCFVDWSPGDRTFVDTCDGRVYPENGDGLVQYRVSVDPDGGLVINLNAPDGES